MNLPDGIYTATALAASVYENQNGSLVLALNFSITNEGYENQNIVAYQTLANATGEINTRNIGTLKAIFGWDGNDPFWLEDPANLADKPAQLTIEERAFTGSDGVERTGPSVKWIDAPGGAGRLPASGDRKNIITKYGARFRALAGGAPVKAPVKNKTADLPGANLPLEKPKEKPAPPTGPTSTMEACWQILCEQNAGAARPALESKWFEALKTVGITGNNSDVTPQQWGALKMHLDEPPF